ncbi:MAG: DUF4271 domain-containing protein [Bacteroidales bacterium]|nr:DUF4271 domain-containing protein [Bacteroidales bacterium]
MNKTFLYQENSTNQQDTVKPLNKDSLKHKVNIEFLKGSRNKSDTHQDSLIKMIRQGYDATSYYFVQTKKTAPLKDYFLNPQYFSEQNQISTTELKSDSLNSEFPEKFTFKQSDVLLLVLLFLASLIAFVRFSTHNYIKQITASVFSFAYSRTLFNERSKLLFVKDFILQFVFFISAGILAIHFSLYFHWLDENEITLKLYIWYPLIIFFIIFIYRVFIRILGELTYTSVIVSEYLYYFGNSLKFLGIFNVIVLFALLFGVASAQIYMIYLSFFVYISLYLIRLYKIFFDFLANRFSLFYFILYFCALEIVPIIMLIKQISVESGTNFVF